MGQQASVEYQPSAVAPMGLGQRPALQVAHCDPPAGSHRLPWQRKQACPFRASGESTAPVTLIASLPREEQNALTSLSCCWHLAHR